MGRPDVAAVTDSRAVLAALAHPFRRRLMDVLKVDGPSTAACSPAHRPGVGNVSHHLKVLAAAGLVEEAPELARDRRERWWRLVTGVSAGPPLDADPAARTVAERPRRSTSTGRSPSPGLARGHDEARPRGTTGVLHRPLAAR